MHKLVLLITVLVLATAACGNDSDEAGGTTTTTGATATTGRPSASTTTSGNGPAVPVETSRCPTIGFTPNSEDAASEITATGLSCAEAEDLVQAAGRQTSSGGPPQLDVSGYHCVRTGTEEDPLPRAFYECVNGSKTVTFVRS